MFVNVAVAARAVVPSGSPANTRIAVTGGDDIRIHPPPLRNHRNILFADDARSELPLFSALAALENVRVHARIDYKRPADFAGANICSLQARTQRIERFAKVFCVVRREVKIIFGVRFPTRPPVRSGSHIAGSKHVVMCLPVPERRTVRTTIGNIAEFEATMLRQNLFGCGNVRFPLGGNFKPDKRELQRLAGNHTVLESVFAFRADIRFKRAEVFGGAAGGIRVFASVLAVANKFVRKFDKRFCGINHAGVMHAAAIVRAVAPLRIDDAIGKVFCDGKIAFDPRRAVRNYQNRYYGRNILYPLRIRGGNESRFVRR